MAIDYDNARSVGDGPRITIDVQELRAQAAYHANEAARCASSATSHDAMELTRALAHAETSKAYSALISASLAIENRTPTYIITGDSSDDVRP